MELGPRCSLVSADVGEPLPGTAPVAAAWLLVEQPGPWGREAPTQSHLPGEVAHPLAAAAAAAGVRLGLVRRPGRHPDRGAPRSVFLAFTRPGASALRLLRMRDPRELLDLDLTRLATQGPGSVGEPSPPVLAVCTNARRDRCCAIGGRPLAAHAAAAFGGADAGRVWETSHLGGHRFSPTAVVLPQGSVHGRLTDPQAVDLLVAADAGRLAAHGYRGRSAFSKPAQVGEALVRAKLGIEGVDDLDAASVWDAGGDGGPGWLVEVTHRDGRRWTVAVHEVESAQARPESCGKPAVALRSLLPSRLQQVT
ncbi:MAG TPA: sucrase ferredoxin [Actinomycetes bacterium]|nr:sucrase ferredoxin [Actinomycetes bacterium]